MDFLEAYRASLKPAEVEEPIDRWLHRPLGHIVAFTCYPIRVITPNVLTFASLGFGLLSVLCILWSFPRHMPVAGALLLFCVILDCADGQLARMRKSYSAIGRMLDGNVDATIQALSGLALIWITATTHGYNVWEASVIIVLGLVTLVTSSFHMVTYDHYKSIWYRFTTPEFHEAESHDEAMERWKADVSPPLWRRALWWFYFRYLQGQSSTAKRFDPEMPVDIGSLPSYSPEREAIFRKHESEPFRLIRWFCGSGSLMFGLELATLFDATEVLLFVRLVLLNILYYGFLRQMQRRATKRLFLELADLKRNELIEILPLPDPPTAPAAS